MTDIIETMRLAESGGINIGGKALRQAVAEIEHLRRQRDELQACNTRLVEERRDLRAQIAGCPVVRIKRMGSPDIELPRYETTGAAGMDLRADVRELRKRSMELMHGPWGISGSCATLYRGTRAIIPCGFAFEIPTGWEGQVRPRSGMTKQGVYAATGTIDSDYRGVVMVHLENRSDDEIDIEHGMRVAQLIIALAPQVRLEEVEELSHTARSTGGFGSTGVR